MDELVADVVSFFSSMGSRRHGIVTAAPCLETYPILIGCGGRCNPFWSWLLPRSGMTSLQGKAKGMMECWYTRAERQPGERGGDDKHRARNTGFPGVRTLLLQLDGSRLFLLDFFTVVLMPHMAIPLTETTMPTEGSGR